MQVFISAIQVRKNSDQRQFDRLIKRNNIHVQEMYKTESPCDEESKIENIEERQSSNQKKTEVSNYKQNMMSEIEEESDKIDLSSTPEVTITVKNDNSRCFIIHSEEKDASRKLINIEFSQSNQSNEKILSSDSKLVSLKNSISSDEQNIARTPEKVPYDYVAKSEESKESEVGSKSGSSIVTPFKQLETITEQATDLEMDLTNAVKSDSSCDKKTEEKRLTNSSMSNSKSQTPCKNYCYLIEDIHIL